ncbi:MAG: hypothetical protein K0S51_274 [Bacillales bacterium]|jgi:hypothetical protein|nr:hypothetical protein [Bacillales bacterium]
MRSMDKVEGVTSHDTRKNISNDRSGEGKA